MKVRQKTYLWGSAGINVDLSWPLLLVIHNDAFGDAVELGTESVTAPAIDLGTIGPGECWTTPLAGLKGVHATCVVDTDSTLSCAILTPKTSEA